MVANKIILDLCGGTGAWSKPYKEASYDIRLITLPDNDIRTYIPPGNVYGVLAAPPCTKFSKACWRVKKKDRDFKSGMIEVRACLNIIWAIQENGAPLRFWALENPMGYLYNFLGYPKFYFQPWQFGELGFIATKRTALWGYFNSPDSPNESTLYNVWYYSSGYMKTTKDKPAYKHPAMFPEQLAKDHILSWSNKGDIVLDPMCGSGTTCKMAKKNGRKYIGIDTEIEYCELSRRRVNATPEPLF